MWSHLPDYQSLAENVVTEIAIHLVHYQQRHSLMTVWEKPDNSFVTPADYGVQYFLKKQLRQAFPDIPFIGEEVLTLKEDAKKLPEILAFLHNFDPQVTEADLLNTLTPQQLPSSLFWLADPIDGTSGFIRKRSFAIALTLIHEGSPILAVMACPSYARNVTIYSAAKGLGLTIYRPGSTEKLPLNNKNPRAYRYCEASLAASNQQHYTTRLLGLSLPGTPQAFRTESQYKYALVAEGFADFFIRYPFVPTQARTWDHAPGAFLVEEAGGIVTDVFGEPLDYGRKDFVLDNHPIILASGSLEIHETTLQVLQRDLHILPTLSSL